MEQGDDKAWPLVRKCQVKGPVLGTCDYKDFRWTTGTCTDPKTHKPLSWKDPPGPKYISKPQTKSFFSMFPQILQLQR